MGERKIVQKPYKRIKSFILLVIIFTLIQGKVLADSLSPLPPPAFSHTSGFYDSPFNLLLSTDVGGATIYYTLDGSDPYPGNLDGNTYQYKNTWAHRSGDPTGDFLTGSYFTYVYFAPISIDNRSSEPDSITNKASSFHYPAWYFPESPVFKGTVVRAITAKEGYTSSPAVTHTFFVHPQGRDRFSLPVITLNTNEDHLYDYHKGIYTPGEVFDNWRKNNPGLNANGGHPANYRRRGDEWEYPAHLTFWDKNSTFPDLSQAVGFRIHGGWSRAEPMKSLRIYARSDYGFSTLGIPFFPDQNHNDYKRIILRNSGNDYHSTLFRDAVIQEVCRDLNFETQAYRPAILFLNGEYWGIHNIRERYDKHYLLRVFGIDHDSLDYMTWRHIVKEGDSRHYLETLSYIENNDLHGDDHYKYIQTRIDTENFIDYHIANIFSRNTDWPGNNIDYFRKRTGSYQPDAPYGHDGRWRWMAFDMDFGFGLYSVPPDHNTLEFATEPGGTDWPNPDWSTFLLRNFLNNESFKKDFINRFADLLNTSFLACRIDSLITRFKNELEPEFREHVTRWKQPSGMSSWNTQVNHMRNFVKQRGDHQWGHLLQFFGLSDTVSVTLDVSYPEHGYIRVNTIDILSATPGVNDPAYPWTGRYFDGLPIRIEAAANEGYRFSHWEGADSSDVPVLFVDPAEAEMITAHFLPEETKELIHYWHFNNSDDIDPLLSVVSDYSAGNHGVISYPGSGAGYMDRVSDGTDINMKMDQEQGRGLRVRNPSDTRELVVHTPSTGFDNLTLSFAVKRTTNGAVSQTLYASPDMGENWKLVDEDYAVDADWRLVSFDISGVPELNDNPHLLFKIKFGGENAGGSSGNNRFDNISLEGDLLYDPESFYSKAEGDLDELSTWGHLPDGSGTPPESFNAPVTVYYIQNRSRAYISDNWSVSGINSKVVLGNGTGQVEFTISSDYYFSGRIDIADNATLILQNTLMPELELISPLSTVIFEQNEKVAVPPDVYGSLHLRNSTKVLSGNYTVHGHFKAEDVKLSFDDQTSMVLEGDLSYLGIVETINPENVNMLAGGTSDQTFLAEDRNRLDAYNIYVEKKKGVFILAMDLYARNNLRLDLSGDAFFSDGSHLLQLDDDLRITGNDNNFDLNGTILLTAEDGTNDMEIINVAISNLIIDVTGEARPDFNSAGDLIRINKDLTIRSRSSRPVRLRNKRYHISGNLLIDVSEPGQIEQSQSFVFFNGKNEQSLEYYGYDGPGILQNVIIDNPEGVILANGSITISGLLHLEKGVVETSRNNMLKIGSAGTVSQTYPGSYINGPMGIYNNIRGSASISFPIGKENGLRKVILDLEHENDDLRLYTTEYFNENPPQFTIGESMSEIIENEGYYNIESDRERSITLAAITLSYSEDFITADQLRIVMSKDGQWINLGAELIDESPGLIRSAVSPATTGFFALAGKRDHPVFDDNKKVIPVYPNPVAENGTIYLPGTMDVIMVNSQGMILLNEKDVNILKLRGIPPGIYFIKNTAGQRARIVILREP